MWIKKCEMDLKLLKEDEDLPVSPFEMIPQCTQVSVKSMYLKGTNFHGKYFSRSKKKIKKSLSKGINSRRFTLFLTYFFHFPKDFSNLSIKLPKIVLPSFLVLRGLKFSRFCHEN